MKSFRFLFLLLSMSLMAQEDNKLLTFFEKGNGNQSATYEETIAFYKKLDSRFASIKMQEMGADDSGLPLHIVIYDPDQVFDFENTYTNKAVILINNGIHAGEPDGIDATMMLFRDFATGKRKAPSNTILVTIPVYNIAGALNRNSTTRANQNGPEDYGFRGNARNYDLNRDFIKADTKNTRSFAGILHIVNPEIFIDNHVSNGADYQYILTYIMTEHNKLGPDLGDYFNKEMLPAIVSDLKKKKIESTPYVNAWGETPDKGFQEFFESPRFATGYTSLFNTIGFVVETHMLKKYADRVKATYEFMISTIDFTDKNYQTIKAKRLKNQDNFKPGMQYNIKWEIDSSKVEKLTFLGYEGIYKKSDVTNGQRLFYDRSKPYKKQIPFYKEFKSVKQITIPKAYIIPKAFWDVLDLVKGNELKYTQLKNDTVIEVQSYKIADYQTRKNAYEGHYPHSETKVDVSTVKVKFSKGDYVFPTDQPGVKYLLETLEPEAVDSFFNWNFFDTMLQQKEGYSDYVFEDTAAKLLNDNPELRKKFEEALRQSKEEENKGDLINVKLLHNNPDAQLDWIYMHSPYYEKAHLQYPIYRIMN